MNTKVAGRVGNKGWEHSTGYRWQLVGWEHPIRYSVVLGVQDLSHIPFYTPSWNQGERVRYPPVDIKLTLSLSLQSHYTNLQYAYALYLRYLRLCKP